jgi:integrase
VFPSGRKAWILSYRVQGKQHRKQLGLYPSIGCKEARQAARQFKAEAQGKNTTSPSVRSVINEWLQLMTPRWSSQKYIYTVTYRLNYITSHFADRPIHTIERKDVANKVKEIVNAGTIETAKRSLRLLRELFDYAIACDYTSSNPLCLSGGYHTAAALHAKEMSILKRQINPCTVSSANLRNTSYLTKPRLKNLLSLYRAPILKCCSRFKTLLIFNLNLGFGCHPQLQLLKSNINH